MISASKASNAPGCIRARAVLAVLIAFSAAAVPAGATDYYVNPGSSITAAMAATVPGDTVHVNAGTYHENVQVNVPGNSSAYISLVANGAVVIDAGGAGKALRIAASYISVSGFECTNFLEGLNMRTAHIRIKNCNFHSGSSPSNPVAGSNGLTVNFDSAIDDISIDSSNFYYNDAGGADFGCNNTTDVLTNITLTNCKFYANNNLGGTDGIGIGHQGTKSNIKLIRCQAYDNLSDGFDLDAPVYMDGCIAHDNDRNGGPNWGVGLKAWGHTGNPPVYGQVTLINCLSYNNTQETAGGGGINVGGANSLVANCLVSGNNSYAGIIICSGASLTIKNTIFYKEHNSISADSDTSGLTFDASNVLYGCSSNGALNSTAAANAKSFDPQFVNPVDNDAAPWGDFHLQSTSPAIDAGVSISGLSDDADGNARPSGNGFDIGPYEVAQSVVSKPAITSALSAGGTVGSGFSYTITASNTPTGFNATGLPGGLAVNTSTGVISGTPTSSGSFSVTISAINSAGSGSASLALTIAAQNVAPVITSAASASPNPATVGQSVSFSSAASDANGDFLSYAWNFGDGASASGASAAHSYSASGTFNVVVTVSDGRGGSTSSSVAITVSSVATGPNLGFESPALGAGAYQYNPANAAWTFVGQSGMSANGSGFTYANPGAPEGAQVAVLQNLGSFSQALTFQDGMSYTFVFAAAQRANYAVQDFQVFLDSTALGTFTMNNTSYADFTTAAVVPGAGSHTLRFVGKNSAGGDATAFIDNVRIVGSVVNPPPSPPVITSSGSASGTVGVAFSYAITATNSPSSYFASGLPSGLSLNTATGVISGTPTAAAVSTLTVSATNSVGTGSTTVTLTINPAVVSPTLHVSGIAMSLSSTRAGMAALATVSIRDNNGAAVTGATVSGTWSGLTSATVSGTTGTGGKVKFTSARVKAAKTGLFTFTVTGVSLSGYTYAPQLNALTSASISTTGTVTTAAAPVAALDLGSVSLSQSVALTLPLPDAIDASAVHGKALKLPAGLTVRGAALGGKARHAGTFTFSVVFQLKTVLVEDSGVQTPAVVLSAQNYTIRVTP